MIATIFVVVFALACVSLFVLGLRKDWREWRILSAGVAIVSFLLALLFAAAK